MKIDSRDLHWRTNSKTNRSKPSFRSSGCIRRRDDHGFPPVPLLGMRGDIRLQHRSVGTRSAGISDVGVDVESPFDCHIVRTVAGANGEDGQQYRAGGAREVERTGWQADRSPEEGNL